MVVWAQVDSMSGPSLDCFLKICIALFGLRTLGFIFLYILVYVLQNL
jgi:hypothetical protein